MPSKLIESTKRRILREESRRNLRPTSVVKAIELTVEARHVHQILSSGAYLRYKRVARTPAMKKRHDFA